MFRRKNVFNKKRKIDPNPGSLDLKALAKRASYSGNPEHKRNPGDFVLSPPTCPRPDKSLCDDVGIFHRKTALKLLREGIARGLVSFNKRGDFPQNVWVVTADKEPLEAQLENETLGSYHGYPMPLNDPFRKVVLSQWANATS